MRAPSSRAPGQRIALLASLLPPAAPLSADLNPLADLVAVFVALPVLPRPAAPLDQEANRQEVHAALHALKATFEHLIDAGRVHGVPKRALKRPRLDHPQAQDPVHDPDAASVLAVKAWLTTHLAAYLAHASAVAVAHWDPSVRHGALAALLALHRSESRFLTLLHRDRQARWADRTFRALVAALLVPPTPDGLLDDDTRDEWRKYWDRYDDVRYYFLKEAAALVATYPSPPPNLALNLLNLLESLTTMPTVSSELNDWFCTAPVVLKAPLASSKKRKAPPPAPSDGSTGVFDSSDDDSSGDDDDAPKLSSGQRKKLVPPLLSLPAHRKVFQDCWLALLSLPLREDESKRILLILHRQVLVHMPDPKRLMDWLTDCANAGGTTAILALNGLFTLITKHNLEYPDFFTRLYALLDRSVLHVRYRARFFRLLDVFMSSSHLPSALIASFIKRLARLALSAPPAAIVTVLPFIYNLLKLHPSCMVLIHRPSDDDLESDPFLPAEPDPLKTLASRSSLWELATLQHHYSASVSGLARVFNEVMSKQSYAMEDFLDHSYGTMFETEMQRKIRSAPALAPVPQRQPIGDSFFPAVGSKNAGGGGPEDEEAREPVDIVAALWTF